MNIFRSAPRSATARFAAIGGLLAALPLAPPCHAATPRTLDFQGTLTYSVNQTPKPDGTYSVTFRLFDVATGGTALWTESNKPVVVAGGHGVFNTVLGAPMSFGSLAFDKPYFLEVQVAGEPAAMAPRLPLATVPYALHADAAPLGLPYTGTISSAGSAFAVSNTGAGHALSAVGSGGGVNGSALYAGNTTGIGIISDTNTTDGNLVLFQNGTGDIIKGVTGGGTTTAFEVQHSGLVNTIGGVHATSATGDGVFGSGASNGVEGSTANNAASGVYGGNTGAGYGVAGRSTKGVGVLGESTGDGFGNGGDGVEGVAHVIGKSGVYGHTDQVGSSGVYGAAFAPNGTGVTGSATLYASSRGVAGLTASGTGVFGSASDAGGYGVYGENSATGADAWLGGQYGYYDPFVGDTVNTPVGVIAQGGPNGAGIVAQGSAKYVAGLFTGQLKVAGAFFANDKHFLIDDPLDPANKLLQHSSVESPDMMDIYNGNVTTDAGGNAIVILPPYFEALNQDFRYQLTVVGQFAQAIISSEVKDNKFGIETDKPNVVVSWQATGIRHDAYAKAHMLPAEIEKGASDRGKYENPEAFGQPASSALGVASVRTITPPSPAE
jgi:hypothetical protein